MAANKELASHYRAQMKIGEGQGLEAVMDVIYGTLADLEDVSPSVELWKIRQKKAVEQIYSAELAEEKSVDSQNS